MSKGECSMTVYLTFLKVCRSKKRNTLYNLCESVFVCVQIYLYVLITYTLCMYVFCITGNLEDSMYSFRTCVNWREFVEMGRKWMKEGS